MQQILLFTALGLGTGALISGLALALVATYRGSGTINIATGALAMFGAYVFYGLRAQGYLLFPPVRIAGSEGMVVPLLPAVALTLVVCALAGVALHYLVLRPLRRQAPLATLVATVGVLLIVQAYVLLVFGSQGLPAPDVLPTTPVTMFGGAVPSNRLHLLALVIVLTIVLAAAYRYTRFGLATRAAQESEAEAALSGLNAGRLALANTVISAVIAGGLGIFVAPLTQLDPSTIALAVVPALGAALLARFTSFLIAAVAGLGMGILASLVTVAQTYSWFPTSDGVAWPGVTDLLYFLVIVVALLWRGQSLPDRGTLVEPRLPKAPAPERVLRPTVLAGGVALVALFVLPYDLRQALILSLIGAVACLSLVLLTGLVGQVSLFQFGLAGVAGLILSKLTAHTGLGWPWAPLIGVVGAVVLGLLMALPALRVRGVQLAILTLAGAVVLNSFGFGNSTWGVPASGAPVAQPSVFGFSLGTDSAVRGLDGARPSPLFGAGVLLVLIACAVLVANIRRGSLGKRMLAVRSNERAAAAVGISPARIKLVTFALATVIMALAGILYSYNFGSLDPTRFTVLNTLSLVAFAYLGGITTVRGAVLGGLLITQGLFSYVLNTYLGISVTFQLILAGVLLVVTVITNPDGIALAPPPRWPSRLWRRLRGAQAPAPDLVEVHR
ncbi:ABC transporter permease [Cryptosporangium aurantiacum]|uniref:Branched-chain amino acid transport system permease protein n=1 Tax=Cryptosporangium aurantiacum TaxID=134849 RepID=A0A1M7R382_9ACTN|nr:ABC transporter permease [Cryptosporangium aurantiacum]SHN39400.1 branched-chain amino acid transport system permease protein [Cryptosporangium aurantiacum]